MIIFQIKYPYCMLIPYDRPFLPYIFYVRGGELDTTVILDDAPIGHGHGFGTGPDHLVRDQGGAGFHKNGKGEKLLAVKDQMPQSTAVSIEWIS